MHWLPKTEIATTIFQPSLSFLSKIIFLHTIQTWNLAQTLHGHMFLEKVITQTKA